MDIEEKEKILNIEKKEVEKMAKEANKSLEEAIPALKNADEKISKIDN